MKKLISCLILFVVLTVITGVVYPAVVTGIAYIFFPQKAAGSLVKKHGNTIGSSLIGQKFSSPSYFWGRPSASDYGTMPSGASNLSPTSVALKQAIAERTKALAPYFSGQVPPELLFATASGLDPHISPQAALAQVDHVAKARGLSGSERERLAALVNTSAENPSLNFLGSARVNVLQLNLALDDLFPHLKAKGATP